MTDEQPSERAAALTDPRELRARSSDTDTLTLIRTSFPGRDELVERVFRDSVPFRALCEDYRDCVAACHHWKQLNVAEAPTRSQEYAELLVELGWEIQTWLEALEIGSFYSSRGTDDF